MARLGYDPADPTLDRQRIVTGSGIEYAPRTTVRSATAIGQKVTNLDVLCHDLPAESGVDGLLGLSFLKHFKLTIRFRKGIIDLNRER
jgi:predicted aspartyl protease